MKITIIQDFLRSGGTERQSILLANAFARLGHAATLLTFRPGGALASTVSAAVQRRILQPFDLHLDWFAPSLTREVAASRPDVILCMGRMANCYAGRLQRAFPQAAVIATMRTGKNLPALFRRSLAVVRHIVANSHDARETLQREHRVPTEKISVIHNSLVFPSAAEGAVPSPRDSLRTLHPAAASTTVLLCVAMFRPEKNQRELIEIVSELPATLDWQLWLAGDGPARPACETLVRARGLETRVRFLGFHRDPSPLYRAADVAVHASWSEALSNFLIEAQAHGLPVVAYQAQGIEECFVPGQTGWAIKRDDRGAFRAAVENLASRLIAERDSLTLAARDYARRTFDPDTNVQRYLDLFSRLTAAPSPLAPATRPSSG